ncbi:MAG: TIGR04283 family arsenosugar biosynthesis glycosyltransferase [Halioglobus sp.]
MSASVAFVIPVLNEAKSIAGLLEALEYRFPGAGICVVDGGSSDDTAKQVLRGNAQLLLAEPGRSSQMNLGGFSCAADYLVFLHADTVPGCTWDEFQNVLATGPEWGFCRIQLSGASASFRVIEWFMNQRSTLTRVATGDQMLFVRSDVFSLLDGFAPLPLMEDIELSKRLRKRCAPAIVNTPAVTSSRRWEQSGIVRTILTMWAIRLAYVCGVSTQTLARYYRGH